MPSCQLPTTEPRERLKVVADDNFIDKSGSGLVGRHRRLHAEAESLEAARGHHMTQIF